MTQQPARRVEVLRGATVPGPSRSQPASQPASLPASQRRARMHACARTDGQGVPQRVEESKFGQQMCLSTALLFRPITLKARNHNTDEIPKLQVGWFTYHYRHSSIGIVVTRCDVRLMWKQPKRRPNDGPAHRRGIA